VTRSARLIPIRVKFIVIAGVQQAATQ